jgi:hypothetical protein
MVRIPHSKFEKLTPIDESFRTDDVVPMIVTGFVEKSIYTRKKQNNSYFNLQKSRQKIKFYFRPWIPISRMVMQSSKHGAQSLICFTGPVMPFCCDCFAAL